jgi:hypothetical protein
MECCHFFLPFCSSFEYTVFIVQNIANYKNNSTISFVYFILLNNQRDAALSSHIYSSLQGYSTCLGCFLYPSSGVQLKLQIQL